MTSSMFNTSYVVKTFYQGQITFFSTNLLHSSSMNLTVPVFGKSPFLSFQSVWEFLTSLTGCPLNVEFKILWLLGRIIPHHWHEVFECMFFGSYY